ncbi:MAG: replication initiator protein WhiP [Pyrodictiaceae archaeon]
MGVEEQRLEELLKEEDNAQEDSQNKRYAKRGGPRSKLVEAIAVLLFSRPLRSAEIAQLLGYPPRYISSYLSYWRHRGLFDYENGFWYLTPEGEEYARSIIQREMNARFQQYTTLARQLLESSYDSRARNTIKYTMKDKNVLQSVEHSSRPLQFTAPLTIKNDDKQLDHTTIAMCIASSIEDEDLSEDEKEVLDTLIRHFTKWGTTYTYIDQLEEDMDADKNWLLKILRLLQAKGFIYIYNDRRLGTRIGFSKKLRILLNTCKELVEGMGQHS